MESLQKIYRGKFLIIKSDKKNSLFVVERTDDTYSQTDQDYKTDALNWLEEIKKYKPENILIDDRKMKFIISPELQQWVSLNLILPAIKISIKKIVFVETEDFFSKVSIQQTMEESKILQAKVKFFKDLQEAYDWILND